jgi:DNA helicase-2/ATP-dependent DNA helicase PcrA
MGCVCGRINLNFRRCEMDFSKEQSAAMSHGDGPALVLAVPGAGKTTVLIHRTNNLIMNSGIKQEQILSITFSRASASDMAYRYKKTFNSLLMPVFSTIHAFCFGIVRDFSKSSGKSFHLIEDENGKFNKFNIVRDLYEKMNKYQITEEKLESFFSHTGYIKNMMMESKDYLSGKSIDVEGFSEIFEAYEEFKKQNRLIDFDDMLGIAYRLLLRHPKLLNHYRVKFPYIQLDEGQDTSKLQLTILKLLAHPKNNLFIVADDDQSIYGFRGAHPDGLLTFTEDYPDGKLYFMEDNYRSTQNIVSVSDKFIAQNTGRYRKSVKTSNPPKEPVQILRFRTIDDQYKHLAEALKSSRSIKDAAILYRNNLSAVGVANALECSGISFHVRDSRLKFFNHWLLSDVSAFLNFAANPADKASFEVIYYKMKGYISKKMMLFAVSGSKDTQIFKKLRSYPGLPEFYKKQINELELDFRKLARFKPESAIRHIQDKLQYEAYLKENSQRSGYTYEYLKEMLYHLKSIAAGCQDSEAFRDRLKHLEIKFTETAKTREGVALSTIHSAKGLEFDNVFIVDLVEGEFPSQSSIEELSKGSPAAYEEERRIFYVGMTRARSKLELLSYLSVDETKTDSSRFLDELQILSGKQ